MNRFHELMKKKTLVTRLIVFLNTPIQKYFIRDSFVCYPLEMAHDPSNIILYIHRWTLIN